MVGFSKVQAALFTSMLKLLNLALNLAYAPAGRLSKFLSSSRFRRPRPSRRVV